MSRTILVPTDGKVFGFSVAEPYPFTRLSASAFSDDCSTYESRTREVTGKYVRRIAADSHVPGVPCETVVAQSFSPADDTISAARRHDCDVTFMASHGRSGLERLLFGSEARKVVSGTDIPAMVFR